MRLTSYLLLGAISLTSTYVLADSATAPQQNDPSSYLQLGWLDKSISPSKNFYKFANGTWQSTHPIPAAYSSWGVFQLLSEKNRLLIKDMLTEAAKNPSKPGSIQQKVGDFYFSAMDETNINKLGTKPLQPEFDRINAIKNLADLQKIIPHLQMLGSDIFFAFGQMQDFKNSDQVIGVAAQSGLSLPDRDYYLKDDAKFKQIRAAFVDHMTKMFQLLGDDQQTASKEAATVMSIETALAKASMSRVAQRDPHAIYHPMNLAQLQQITPNFSWQQYFSDLGYPAINNINLANPDFFKAWSEQLTQVPINAWKTYLRWHLIHDFAPYLSQPFVNENFHMASLLTGTKELLPRWQRATIMEDDALGFAVGQMYVEKYFPPAAKQAAIAILHNIRAALRADLQNLAWMTPETRIAAIKKLDMMGERIGYPDKWLDYSPLTIDRGPLVLNVMRASEFSAKHELNKIGKPVDKTEWDMTPQTINAYYDPSLNNINIPAGILQPPFFDPKAPSALNYGAIGFVVGHEMTHGFDDQGAQFDGKGNLNNWWTPADLKNFKAATQCIADNFSKYTVADNIHLLGNLVVGEATADLGGLTLASRAFHASADFAQAKTLAGYTPDQQFFLGAAHIWASNIRPEEQRHNAIVDVHPPAIYRVNGTLANMPLFQQAFAVPDDSPMVNHPRCVIW